MNAKFIKIAEQLKKGGFKLSTAESITGGQVAALIVAQAGASDYFEGGVIAYSNQLKVELLGVPFSVILEYGAVSRECALAMARGVRRKLGTDFALATTGIAGPTGATPDKPVGLVWLAVSGPDMDEARSFTFTGERDEVIEKSSREALSLLSRHL